MTPTESQMLNAFLLQLRQVQGIQKNPEAAALIADAAVAQPDALYLLVQRALLQDQALASAGARIAVLEAQAVPVAPVASGSFLEGGNNAWGRSAAPVSARAYNAPVTTASVPLPGAGVASGPAAVVPQAPAGAGFFGGGGGNFLGTMAATAAGVAGGALLFQGIGSMMGHHGAAAPQSNAFSSMADSVDKPAAAPAPVTSSGTADTSNTDVADNAADMDFGDDDEMV
ncbi:MAG: hypothetical protein ACI9ZF_000088 [Bradyrhizobium sp.]|jgi:hypothetical protein